VLLRESRSPERRGLDLPGVVISSAGLAALTYGAIAAGQEGWGDVTALSAMIAGGTALVAFYAWERRTAGREGGQPLIDLALFRSRGFTWGTILATLVSFVTFGLLFAMPQYFTAVRGTDAMGAGLRLLPLIGGLIVGVITASALQESPKAGDGALDPTPRVGARAIVAFGFAVMAVGFGIGAMTTIESSEAFVAAWLGVVGVGLGFALPATMNAALGAISADRSGVGSALIMALRFVGSTIGVAVLGTIISSGYGSRLDPTGLPETVADVAREGVIAGVAAANTLASPTLLHAVHAAFVDALDIMLWASAAIAVTATILALAFLPRDVRRRSSRALEREESPGRELAA
jgi:MFS transporter, DHA2 family, multidrug resistance protein